MKAAQLKASILQEAVQGRLVPQNADDESASILLERIREEKSRLVAEGVIRADRNASRIYREDGHFYEAVGTVAPVCIDDELPFEIPESWEWARLSQIVYNHGQMRPTQEFSYIDIGSIDNKHQTLSDEETIISAEQAPSRARKVVEIGDILYSTVRPYLHNMCIIDREFSRTPIASTGFSVMACHDGIVNKYLFDYLLSPSFDAYANHTDNARGVAYPAISDERLYKALIPIPPYAEQRRIVAKLDELLPLVEEYGKLESGLSEIDAAFPAALKKSVLQEAVQGRLVPQNADDESASILLERIREEKSRLVAEGVIRADRNASRIYREDGHFYEAVGTAAPVCIDDELPFEIPESWEWVKLENVCAYIQRGKSPKYSQIKKYPVVAQKCIQWSGFSLEKALFIEPETIISYAQERLLQDDDLMWNSTGLGTLGRLALYKEAVNPYELAVADSHVTVIRPFKSFVVSQYLYYYLANPSVQSIIEDLSDGTTKQKELATATVKNYLVPLPPLAEQRRIVAKVEELLSLIDECKEIHI